MINKSLIFLFLGCFYFSFSQDCIYEEFGINDGLPSLEIYDLYQGKDGIIWFATDRGLATYNGYEFTSYGIKDGILNHVVLDFYPQKNGVIYCATFDNQLFYFNEKFNGFIPYAYNAILKEELEFSQHINNLHIDTDGSLHISCDDMLGKLTISKNGEIIEKPSDFPLPNLHKYWMNLEKRNDGSSFHYYSIDSIPNDENRISINLPGLLHNEGTYIENGKYALFKSRKKLYLIDKNKEKLKTIQTDKKPISIKAIDEHHFFTGYFYGGGIIRDSEGTIVEHFLKDKSVSGFLIDNEGGYWFSTLNSGVFYVKEPKIKFVETKIHSPIWTLTKNNDNELYIGYKTGEVLKLDADYNTTYEHNATNNLKAFVEFDSINNELYVHSGFNFYKRDQYGVKNYFDDSLIFSFTTKLSEPTSKGLILSGRSKFTVLEPDKPFRNIDISNRAHDALLWENEIYIGTPLGAYVYKNNVMTSLQSIDSVFSNRVDDIDLNEQRNEIYFATLGAGIIIYDKKNETVQNITKNDGLSSDIINEIYIENKNELWVCTNAGLNKITFKEDNTYQITGLKSINGLLNDGITDVEVIGDKIWIASRKGLIHAPKELFDQKNTSNSYYLKIKSCYVNDAIVKQEALTQLSYKENRIEFLVEGISFKTGKELIYKYTMDGLDTKWYYTNNRNISYPSLPYGNYTLKIAAATLQNDENLTYIEIPIGIKAPFWNQLWFMIAVILAVGLLIYTFFKYRILSYNRHIIREILRLVIKKIKRKEKYFTFKEAGKDIRIKTNTILYVKSSGNYIELVTETKNYTIRKKIGVFIELMPDPLEYLRIHRSYIIRIDKVTEKNSKEVTISNEKLPVSNSYVNQLDKLIF